MRLVPTTVRRQDAQRGIAVPVAVGPDGKLELSEGPEHNRQILQRALSVCDCENPWRQGRGMPRRSVLRVASRATWGIVRHDVEQVFRTLAGRFDLVALEMRPGIPGEVVAKVTYLSVLDGGRDDVLDLPVREAR